VITSFFIFLLTHFQRDTSRGNYYPKMVDFDDNLMMLLSMLAVTF